MAYIESSAAVSTKAYSRIPGWLSLPRSAKCGDGRVVLLNYLVLQDLPGPVARVTTSISIPSSRPDCRVGMIRVLAILYFYRAYRPVEGH